VLYTLSMDTAPDFDKLSEEQLRELAKQQYLALVEKDEALADKYETIEAQAKDLAFSSHRIEKLEALLRRLNVQRFGSSSERSAGQAELQFFNEAELAALEEMLATQAPEVTSVPAHTRKKRRSKPLPKELPRVEQCFELPEAERQCGCGRQMAHIGYESSEQLAVIPQQYYVIVRKQAKYACHCDAGGVVTARKPTSPLPGSQASPQLIAQVMSAKYHDGLPLYRQEKMAKRDGLDLPRAKLARWVIEGSKVLQPVWNLLQDTFFSYDIAAADETGLQVLKEPERNAQNGSWLWLRRGGPPDKPVILVDYDASRSQRVASRLLEETQGYLICDAYPAYNQVAKANNLKLVLCNDHARRKFSEAIKGLAKKEKVKGWVASKALNYYKVIYRLEKQGQTPQQRQTLRASKARPVWSEFLKWADEIQAQGVAHQGTREALAYLLKHQEGLMRYLDDGRLPISNIHTEHVAKTIALARKNFLFADTPAGAEASARAYSLLETAKANGHHPQRYLSVLLTELPNVTNVEQVEQLLPWNLTSEEVARRYAEYPTP